MNARNQDKMPAHVMTSLRNLGALIKSTRKKQKLSAQDLAKQANISRPTLSRVEHGEAGVTFGIYATVLDVLDVTDQLTTVFTAKSADLSPKPSRVEHRSLIWANPQADDSVFIRAALQKPKIVILADIARDFGVARLEQEWETLKETALGRKLANDVNRMLGHLRNGYAG